MFDPQQIFPPKKIFQYQKIFDPQQIFDLDVSKNVYSGQTERQTKSNGNSTFFLNYKNVLKRKKERKI